MLPELFRIGDFPIRSYGLLLMLGVMVAVWMTARRAPRYGLKSETALDILLWALIPGILGARAAFIAQNWDYYGEDVSRILTFRFEGLTSFGGFIFGALGVLLYCQIKKVPARQLGDAAAVPLLVANAIGRIGCFLNGCCYGRPTDAWYGVDFGLGITNTPAQLIETFLCLTFAFTLSRTEGRMRSSGQVMVVGFFLLALSRFIYEFWRGGTTEEANLGIATGEFVTGAAVTQAQVMTLIVMAVMVGLFVLYQRQVRSPRGETT